MKTLARLVFIALALLATASLTEASPGRQSPQEPTQDPGAPGSGQEAEEQATAEDDSQEAGSEEDGSDEPANIFDPTSLPEIDVTTTEEQETALRLVEEILEEQQLLLSGQNFVYQAGSRRDPFRSLLAMREREISAPELRPSGLPGFLINELQLTAIAAFQGRFQAMALGADGRTYFVEVGTTLYDGRVVQITADQVVFEQDVEDLLGARSTRQVVKSMDTENQESNR
ncbi:MAG: hypothetical protein GKS06_07115 [Acidobacteria bacterium]|nr:hypothetical protein [Acidobacteriota bacterium]